MLRLILFGTVVIWSLVSCTTPSKNTETKAVQVAVPVGKPFKAEHGPVLGRLAVIQGPTSDSEALFNIFVPRLTNYSYEVKDESGQAVPVEKYETVQVPIVLYKVDKIFVKGLAPGKKYILSINNSFRGHASLIDQRTFQALDIKKPSADFAAISCMADDWRFERSIDPMWQRLKEQNPDFIILNGDLVYVDTFEFVERKKATETDLWQRYIDSFHRIPVYHWLELKPIFATWDDHDYGTNDGDRTFVSKKPAQKLFRALFSGRALSGGVWTPGPTGVTSEFIGYGQRFYLMDDRTFRQPDKDQKVKDPYGHWGQQQHAWLMKSLRSAPTPSWIFNGDQMFNGKSLGFKEDFEEDHSLHFTKFIDELKTVPAPIVFSSGDVHLTEIMRIPKERLGYETFEVTSSAMHSYLGDGWDNPLRIPESYVREFNFVMIKSTPTANGFKLNTQSWGIPGRYFNLDLTVAK